MLATCDEASSAKNIHSLNGFCRIKKKVKRGKRKINNMQKAYKFPIKAPKKFIGETRITSCKP